MRKVFLFSINFNCSFHKEYASYILKNLKDFHSCAVTIVYNFIHISELKVCLANPCSADQTVPFAGLIHCIQSTKQNLTCCLSITYETSALIFSNCKVPMPRHFRLFVFHMSIQILRRVSKCNKIIEHRYH